MMMMMDKKMTTRWKQEGEKTDGAKTQNLPAISELSYKLLLGLAYWPSIRPMPTAGKRAPQITTREKESMSLIFEDRP